MADRNLTTSRDQVFGVIQKGTECRVCGRNVDDGRAKFCSDYCRELCWAVMNLLNWSSLRDLITKRDEKTCRVCGYDRDRDRQARIRLRGLISEKAGDHPSRSESDSDAQYRERRKRWQQRKAELRERYGHPRDVGRRLEVDHITPISEGGHPFDPGNLQTLCEDCHQDKTSQENSNRAEPRSPNRGELSESLLEYVSDGDDARLSLADDEDTEV